MIKKMTAIGIMAIVVAVVCSSGRAMDYANMTNDELAELRGAILNAPESDRKAYQVEWENRLRNMSEAEKKQYDQEDKNDPGNDQKPKQPYIQGRGYDNQGTGTVIYGGGGPLPPDVNPGGGR
jgi:hypothetical protein